MTVSPMKIPIRPISSYLSEKCEIGGGLSSLSIEWNKGLLGYGYRRGGNHFRVI